MSVRIADAAIVFSGVTGPLARDAADARKHIQSVDKAAAAMGKGGSADGVTASLKEQNLAMIAQKKHLADLRKHQGSGVLGTAAKGIVAGATLGMGMAGFDGLAGLGSAVVDSVKLASNFEQMKISFGVMLGSADKADAMIAGLKDFAAQSPLTFESASTSAKQLIAYGIAADQAIPTLRALTDVASGTGVEIGRLTIAYGQVASAGRLYGTELRQFTEAGVPVIEALAKAMGKPKEAIKNLVEEGKVGFPEVVQAFKAMTEGTGKFAGMTEKYGQSFAGQVEQMQDSIQTLKREVGGAIIKEMGLKEATKDIGAFADRVRAGIGDVVPAIRFVGDLGRAGAQITNEFGKAAVVLARVRLTGLLEVIPALKELPALASSALKDFQDFKIDRVKVAKLGFALMDAMRGPIEMLQGEFGKILGEGKSFKDNLTEAAKSVKATADSILSVIVEANRLTHLRTHKTQAEVDRVATLKAVDLKAPAGDAKPIFDILPKPVAEFDPNRPLNLTPVPQTVRPLSAVRETAADADAKHAAAVDAAYHAKRQKLKDFDATAGAAMGFAAVPEVRRAVPRGLTDAVRGDQPRPAPVKDVRPVKDVFDPIGMGSGGRADVLKSAADLDARDALVRSTRAMRNAFDDFVPHLAAANKIAGSAFSPLAVAAKLAAGNLRLLADMKDQTPARLVELSEKLKKDYAGQIDPIGELKKTMGDLDLMESKGLIPREVKAMAGEDALQNAVKASGIDLSHKPPPAAESGTKEFAKLETSAFGGGSNQNVVDLLKAIKTAVEERVKQATTQTRELGQELKIVIGQPVNMPGG